MKMPTLSLLRKQQMFHCQVHAHCGICWKYNRNEFRSGIVDNLLGRQLLQNHFFPNLAMIESRFYHEEMYY